MRRSTLISVFCLAVLSLFALPSQADAQLVKKLKDAAQNAAEDEAANQVERLLREAIRCAVDDPACARQADEEGKPVIYTDQNGDVITNEDGNPITDRDEAASRAGVALADDAGSPKPGEGAWANYDFIPGEEVLFFEDYADDRVGDFPRRLEWIRGNMEIVEWEGRRLLRATANNSQFGILLPGGVPERFTIEVEIHDPSTEGGTKILTEGAPGKGNYDGAYVNFGSWRGSGLWEGGDPLSTVQDERISEELMAGRIMVDGAYAKVYLNEKRIANAPRVELVRGDRISFVISASDSRPVYIGNIRIAGGGRDLYDKLATEGRVATLGILFDVDSDRIRPESSPTLEQIGKMLQEHPDLGITIEGHTDSTGDDDHNLDLSIRRAEAVRAFLIQAYGIDADRLQAAGFGETQPVADNETPEGRQQNRRVELVVLD